MSNIEGLKEDLQRMEGSRIESSSNVANGVEQRLVEPELRTNSSNPYFSQSVQNATGVLKGPVEGSTEAGKTEIKSYTKEPGRFGEGNPNSGTFWTVRIESALQ